jgi:hypothetical protein
MEKWIILQMLKPKVFGYAITDLDEIAVCHPVNGNLMVFDSLDEASNYQEEWGISGQCVSLPIY